jgi:hypothetical protein
MTETVFKGDGVRVGLGKATFKAREGNAYSIVRRLRAITVVNIEKLPAPGRGELCVPNRPWVDGVVVKPHTRRPVLEVT